MFKKLGIYGRRRPKKSAASNNAQKTAANVAEPVTLPVNKPDPPPVLNDKMLPTALPELPKPTDRNDDVKPSAPDQHPAPTSSDSRSVY